MGLSSESQLALVTNAWSQKRYFSAKNIIITVTWNQRMLYQKGQLVQLLQEFNNDCLDILGISDLRWTGSRKKKY